MDLSSLNNNNNSNIMNQNNNNNLKTVVSCVTNMD